MTKLVSARTGGVICVMLTALVRILEMVQRHAARQVGQPASYVVHLRDFPLGVGSAVKWLGRAAHDAGIAPGSVTFALPENRLLDAGRSSNRVLASLRDEGFGLGIDAFGADVGSLRLIGDLDPDQIWIDRNLVVGTGGAAAAEGRRGADLDLVEATVTVGRRTGALVGVAGRRAGRSSCGNRRGNRRRSGWPPTGRRARARRRRPCGRRGGPRARRGARCGRAGHRPGPGARHLGAPPGGGGGGRGCVAVGQRGGSPATGGRVDHGKLIHASVRFQA